MLKINEKLKKILFKVPSYELRGGTSIYEKEVQSKKASPREYPMIHAVIKGQYMVTFSL